ncbi:D-sedoheptulose 7-phosphate isomerase [Mucilaginibacter sp. P25]|uniref:Phosphoheptose isomerase n=1 Tax=Mucilaginibacter gossypiicola TaxID=551995 RepID=A0A1H8B328_9SPHI|nr:MULTISPECIES: D-sedoheptulose 7-phosphate isomerase [Mucilaginibacter]UOE52178.1 D-sedoheptulose 7-phosphate isomerase [Mucilaginibacter sp. SMC90]SEM76504.1 D-sedoheptulose 7-phosphate isomerase [Mucilaginibacter gossypiicola]
MENHQHMKAEIQEHLEAAATLKDPEFLNKLEKAAELIIETIKNGKKLLLFGNGGSASDAQHIAAEFTGRYVKERRGLPAIALTTDTSALTAIGNDYGFPAVFSRQVEALAQPGDLVIGISTSGNSENVVSGLLEAKNRGCRLIGLSGANGGMISVVCDITLNVNSDITARVQEMHILIGHLLCSAVDRIFASGEK